MTLADRLRALVAGLPPDGAALLTRGSVEAWLAESEGTDPGHDLSVAEAAARVGKSANTVRRWIAEGRLRAYQPGGRDWRITPTALDEMRRGPPPGPTDPETVDLSSWRRVRPHKKGR